MKWLAGILCVFLAGCGAITQSYPLVTMNTCELAASGVDVQVKVISNESCDKDVAALATDGLYWYVMPAGTFAAAGMAGRADSETMSQICRVYKNGATITVMDAGEAMYGTDICSSEEQEGWTP